MPDVLRKYETSFTWGFRVLVGLMLVAQLWLTSNFVTRADFDKQAKETDAKLGLFAEKLQSSSQRILSLEEFKVQANDKTARFEGSINAVQLELKEMSKQTTANATLLSVYRDSFKDVISKLDLILQQQAVERSRQSSDK